MAVLQVDQLDITQTFLTAKEAKKKSGPEKAPRAAQRNSAPAIAQRRSPTPTSDGDDARRKYTLADFEALQVLGTGNFSVVVLVRELDSGKGEVADLPVYALKTIPKALAVKEKVTDKLFTEKAALAAGVSSSLCLRMTATFQDTDFLYLLTEAADGGDLMSHMLEQDVSSRSLASPALPVSESAPRAPRARAQILSPEDSCFYTGCIAAAIGHMHEHGFAHRDVKPENCLLTLDGCARARAVLSLS